MVLLFLQCLLHGIPPEHGSQLMLIHLTTTDCTNGILLMTHYAPFRANLHCGSSYAGVARALGACEHSYGHWIHLDMPHGRFPLWQLLRERPAVAHPQLCRSGASKNTTPFSARTPPNCEPNLLQKRYLASLPSTADDLPKSEKGWSEVSILPNYFGKRFVNTTREDSENAIIYNFLSGAFEVALWLHLLPTTTASKGFVLTLATLLLVADIASLRLVS